MRICAILMAWGRGERKGSAIPKQFLPLRQKPIALHSLEVLLGIEEIKEIVVVCAPEYRHHFKGAAIKFALPGVQRQDSVFNGLQESDPQADWICIHDSARPFIEGNMIKSLFQQTCMHRAVSLAMPVKNTIKESTQEETVARTLDRSFIWEIQTPQLLKREILEAGFAFAKKHNLSVTDDVSLAELIGEPVKLVRGNYKNVKITTPEDLAFAEWVSSQSYG